MANDVGLEKGGLNRVIRDLSQTDLSVKYNSRISWLFNTQNYQDTDRKIKNFFDVMKSDGRTFNEKEKNMVTNSVMYLNSKQAMMVDRNLMFLQTLTQDPATRARIQYVRSKIATDNQTPDLRFDDLAHITPEEIEQQYRKFEQAAPHWAELIGKQPPEMAAAIDRLQTRWFDDKESIAVLLFMFICLGKDPEDIELQFNVYLESLGVLPGQCPTHYDVLDLCKNFMLAFQAGQTITPLYDLLQAGQANPVLHHCFLEVTGQPVPALHQSAGFNATHDGGVYPNGVRLDHNGQPIGEDVIVNNLDYVVDFSHSDKTWGVLIDGTGHNKARTPGKEAAFNVFVNEIRECINSGEDLSGEKVAKAIYRAKNLLIDRGLDGAGCFASIVEYDGQKYALVLAVKDSEVLVVHQNGSFDRVTSHGADGQSLSGEIGQLNLNTIKSLIRLIPVEDGDLIIGGSDGLFDFMHPEAIIEHAKNSSNAAEFLENCKTTIQSNPEDKKQYFDVKDADHYDDMGAFLLVV